MVWLPVRSIIHSLKNGGCLSVHARAWSGGAMVLGKLPVSGRPTNLG